MPRKDRALMAVRPRKVVSLACKPPEGAVAIALTRGWVAWVDEADYALVEPYTWHAEAVQGRHYAATATYPAGSPPRAARILPMHRLILGAPQGYEVDHREHGRFAFVVDNRRSNLRLAAHAENCRSVRKTTSKRTSSIFKGVSWDAFTGRWKASIEAHGRRRSLGRYPTEAAAARVYDLSAVESFGNFALTNFPVPGSTNWLFSPATLPTNVSLAS